MGGPSIDYPDEPPFTDTEDDDWFYDAILYVYFRGLMNGMSADTFEPQKPTTRAMLVTILYRLEGDPNPGIYDFIDMDPSQWYGPAVSWAANNGVGNGKFAPDDSVTREQVATILFRYAQKKCYNTGARADLTAYSDANSVSEYAVEALTWANGAGIVNGKEGARLDPQGNASRAEIATMLMRFCENIVA